MRVFQLFKGDQYKRLKKTYELYQNNLRQFYADVETHNRAFLKNEAEPADDSHSVRIERVEDEYYLSSGHEMNKNHFISFITAVRNEGFETVKLYPEGNAEARFKVRGTRYFYYYCNRHGLFKVPAISV